MKACDACDETRTGYYVTSDRRISWDLHWLEAPDLFAPYRHCFPTDLNLLTDDVVRFKVICTDRRGFKEDSVAYEFTNDDGGRTWYVHELPSSTEKSNSDAVLRSIYADIGLLLGRKMWRRPRWNRHKLRSSWRIRP